MSLTTRNLDLLQRTLKRARNDKTFFAKAFFGYDLVPRQIEAVNLGGRVSVKNAGRRFGKSSTTNIDVLHELLTKPKQIGYIVGPSIDQTAIYFDEIERQADANPLLAASIKGDVLHRPFPKVTLVNGSVLHGRSTAYEGKYLRGKGADIVAVTEAGFVKDKVYNEVIRALVLDRGGKIRLESTPNGMNYFYTLFQQGLSDPTGYYKAFAATVLDNTRIDPEEIERIRKEIPDLAFRVEYLAEFAEDDTFVFPWRVLQDVMEDYQPIKKPLSGHRYTIGVDLAKLHDWTVITVLDQTEEPFRIAEWARMQHTLYGDVAAFVNDLQMKYKAPVFLDATGVGEAVQEEIRAVQPFVFTQRTRQDLVSRLIVTVEQRGIQLPSANTVLRDELRFFQNIRRGQSVKPEAAPGYHDDAVMSLALAVWGATESPNFTGISEYYRRLRESAATKQESSKPKSNKQEELES